MKHIKSIPADKFMEIIRNRTDGYCKEAITNGVGILYLLIAPKQLCEIVEDCGIKIERDECVAGCPECIWGGKFPAKDCCEGYEPPGGNK
ncbi:MAG: hypothetical protein IMF10_09325 [Proteobacteria bacterium]|nr:hypothetical protein [Pseudomonadota bacterium]